MYRSCADRVSSMRILDHETSIGNILLHFVPGAHFVLQRRTHRTPADHRVAHIPPHGVAVPTIVLPRHLHRTQLFRARGVSVSLGVFSKMFEAGITVAGAST